MIKTTLILIGILINVAFLTSLFKNQDKDTKITKIHK